MKAPKPCSVCSCFGPKDPTIQAFTKLQLQSAEFKVHNGLEPLPCSETSWCSQQLLQPRQGWTAYMWNPARPFSKGFWSYYGSYCFSCFLLSMFYREGQGPSPPKATGQRGMLGEVIKRQSQAPLLSLDFTGVPAGWGAPHPSGFACGCALDLGLSAASLAALLISKCY